jgi:hypothetical protein
MEVYRRETLHIIEQYLDGAISFAECISALDEALAAVFPPPTSEQLDSLRALSRWNQRIAMTEFERRTSDHE